MEVNVAVVGLGYWGPNLARAFASTSGARLHTLCDSNGARLVAVARDYPGVRTTTDYGAVLAAPDVDAVVLATPAATHFKLAFAALQAGKHVLVEKPMAQSAAECRALIEQAEARRRVLMVGHVFLYNAAVRKIKELIDSGALGRLYYIYAQRLNLGIIRQDVNALWNLAPHDISVINYWLGAIPTVVLARGYAYVQPGIEDVFFMTLEYPGDVAANVHVSWLDPHKVRRITVVGSERMAEFDDMNPEARVVVYNKRAATPPSIPNVNGVASSRGMSHRGVEVQAGDVTIPRIGFEEPLRAECEHFLECVTEGRRPLSDGAQGLQVVQVLEAAEESLRKGSRVVLDG